MLNVVENAPLPPAPVVSGGLKNQKVKVDPSIAPLKTPADPEASQSCRMLYRAVMVSADVQMIVLDVRRMQGKTSLGCDYLGKEQAEWLSHTLRHSHAIYKIICIGKSFGVCSTETITKQFERFIPPVTVDTTGFLQSASGDSLLVNSGSIDDGIASISKDFAVSTDEVSLDGLTNKHDVTDVTVPPRKESLKHVSMMVPSEHKHLPDSHHDNHTMLYDDLDEHYGRSKYSLQHILAEYERKLKEANASEAGSVVSASNSTAAAAAAAAAANTIPPSASTAPPTLNHTPVQSLNTAGTYHHIPLQTGIIILSSGIGTHWTNEEEIIITTQQQQQPPLQRQLSSTNATPVNSLPSTPLVTKTTNVTNIDDIMLPFYCSAYYNLSSAYSQNFTLLDGPFLSSLRGNPAFCLEVSLGTITMESHSKYQNTLNNEGNYYYLSGMDAFTYYSQYQVPNATTDDTSYSFAEFFVLPDGALKISVYSSTLPPSPTTEEVGLSGKVNDDTKQLLYECICTVPNHLSGDGASDDQSVGSVFMI
jgi:hypothetical protein